MQSKWEIYAKVSAKIIQEFTGMSSFTGPLSCMQCFYFFRSHHNEVAIWDKTVKDACGSMSKTRLHQRGVGTMGKKWQNKREKMISNHVQKAFKIEARKTL